MIDGFGTILVGNKLYEGVLVELGEEIQTGWLQVGGAPPGERLTAFIRLVTTMAGIFPRIGAPIKLTGWSDGYFCLRPVETTENEFGVVMP